MSDGDKPHTSPACSHRDAKAQPGGGDITNCNPDEYGICKHPNGRVICVHVYNSCGSFKKRLSS